MASDKRKYVTSDQKAILVDFIRSNTRMIKPKLDGSFTMKECNRLWEQLAVNLNSLDGARKSAREWRKCWHDLRRNTKEKVAKLKKQGNKIGQGLQEDLTPIQEKVIGIIEGQENPPTSMFMFDIKQEHDNVDFLGDNAFKPEEYEQPNPTPAPDLLVTDLIADLAHKPVPETPQSPPKRVVKCGSAVKRMKSLAEKKLSIKKSYYDRKLALLERHIQAIDRQTEAINKQTVVHEKLMQLLSRK